MPLVSIVTPSFNQAQYLEQTIRSVLEQEVDALEYFVMDGGSTDGSLEIIRKYADQLAGWVSEKDKGQADAINKGLHRARGEIVAWLNSDDLYRPGVLAEVVRIFGENPQVGLVFGDVFAIDEKGQLINLMRYGRWGLEELMAFNIIGQPAVFMRREVLEQAGLLDISYHCLLDHHLWLRMALLAGMLYVPRPLAAARYHSRAKNLAQPVAFACEAHRIATWMQSHPALGPVFARNEKRIRAGLYRLSAFYLIEGGRSGAALKDYGRGFVAHPPTILRAWRRVLLAVLNLFGLGRLKALYLSLRRRLVRSGFTDFSV
ncbi:MAG: glycosyltransferase [Anaerolineales bacterium]|nr:glycosyltransferase [Anaerolineales bacterium]